MLKKINPYLVIVISILFIILSPKLFNKEMFMDGLIYAAISNNLSENIGSFWDLHFSTTLFNHFYEHPPLAIGLESLFFNYFGHSYLVEKFYSLATFFISGYIICLIS